MMMMTYLAQSVHAATQAGSPPDQNLSGNWLLYAFGVVVSIAVGAYLRISGKKAGIQEASNNVTLQDPVPELPVREVKHVSWDMHTSLDARVARIEHEQQKMNSDIKEQFRDLVESAHERELRIGEKIDKRADKSDAKIEGIAVEWHRRIDLQFGPKPRTR